MSGGPVVNGSELRRFALRRLRAGDWLLLSNDGRILWRFVRSMDGPSGGLDWARDRYFWEVWSYRGPAPRELRERDLDVMGGAWEIHSAAPWCDRRGQAVAWAIGQGGTS